MPDSDRALLERWIAARDAEAFADIVSRHAALVYSTCKRITRNATEAEDVAQECFIELARVRRVIAPSLAGWLYRVAVRRSLDQMKSESRRKRREARYMETMDMSASVTWDDIQAHVDEAIAALPEKLRQPIIYRFLEGQTQNAIAQNLAISDSTVQYRLNRGIERIHKFLKGRGIIAPSAIIASLLAEHLTVDAAPATLTAALGKLALASGALSTTVGTSSAGITALGGLLTMGINKIAGIVAAICVTLVLTGGALYMVRERTSPGSQFQVTELVPAKRITRTGTGSIGPAQDELTAGTAAEPHRTPSSRVSSSGMASAGDNGTLESSASNGQKGAADKDAAEEASVCGRVTDSQTNPIAGAKVQVQGAGASASAASDKDGYYRIANVKRNVVCRIIASATGYGDVARDHIAVPAKGDVTGIDFVLQTGSSVAGCVLDTSGNRIAKTRVMMQPEGAGAGASGATDSQGSFEIRDVAAGTYTFAVTKERGYQRALNDPLSVAPGKVITGLEVVIEERTGSIEGRAVNEQGSGIGDVSVRGYSAEGSANTRTDPSGFYRLEDLGKGSVTIEFTHPSYANAHLADVPIGALGADVVMVRYGSIAGTVSDAVTRNPVRDFTIDIVTNYKDAGGVLFESKGSHTFSSESGEFVIENVQPSPA